MPEQEQIADEIQAVLDANGLTGSEPEIQAYQEENAGAPWEDHKDPFTALAESLKPDPPDFTLSAPDLEPEPDPPEVIATKRAQEALDIEIGQIRQRGDADLPAVWAETFDDLKASIDERVSNGERVGQTERMNLLTAAQDEFTERFGIHPGAVQYQETHPNDPQQSMRSAKIVIPVVTE